MATRRSSAKSAVSEPVSALDRDATELGHLVKQGGFRLGLLCARCITIGNHGGDRSSSHVNLEGKVSVAEFATKSNVSESKIRLYYRAWEMAAETGICARPEDLSPGMEDEGGIALWDEDSEEDENLRQKWSYWLAKARKPKKELEAEEDSESKPDLSVVPDPEDESDSIDEDFGLPEKESEDERAEANYEADAINQRERLVDILESVRAQVDSVSGEGEILGDNEGLLSQIVSAAEDLRVVAQAMIDKAKAA